jgi:uncharacterized membrane protein
LFLLAGCGAPGEDPSSHGRAEEGMPTGTLPFPVPSSLSGELLLDEEGVGFLPCGAGESLRIRDRTGSEAASIVEDLGYGDGRVLAAVVLEGDELREVRFAAPEGRRCEQLLPEEDLAAMGNEPFWSLRIRGGEARWTTPEDMDGTAYAPGTWEEGGPGEWVLTVPPAEGEDDPGEGPVVLRLLTERCVDTMAGSRFPFSARVERGGRTYEGCAVERRGAGDGARR